MEKTNVRAAGTAPTGTEAEVESLARVIRRAGYAFFVAIGVVAAFMLTHSAATGAGGGGVYDPATHEPAGPPAP